MVAVRWEPSGMRHGRFQEAEVGYGFSFSFFLFSHLFYKHLQYLLQHTTCLSIVWVLLVRAYAQSTIHIFVDLTYMLRFKFQSKWL